MSRKPPGARADYRWFYPIATRWMDNDAFQHVNNVQYYSYFDTAVTYFEITHGLGLLGDGPVRCFVVETQCRFHHPVAFPDRLTVGLRAARIGTTSVRYELAVFREDEDEASAEGHFVHVFVDTATQRPVPVPERARVALNTVLAVP